MFTQSSVRICVMALVATGAFALSHFMDSRTVYGAKTITATVQKDRGVGVAFELMEDTDATGTVILKRPTKPEGWYIVTNEESTEHKDPSGTTFWERTSANESEHVWEGHGFTTGPDDKDDARNFVHSRTYVRFEGLLFQKEPGEGDPPPFSASVADLDLAMPGVGDVGEANNEEPYGGFPMPVLWDGDAFPNPLPLDEKYGPYVLSVTLRLSWGGPSATASPENYGYLTLGPVGGDASGVKLYNMSGTPLASPISIMAEDVAGNVFTREYLVVTNNMFDGAVMIEGVFQWHSSIASKSGNDKATDKVRVTPVRITIRTDSNNDGHVDEQDDVENALEDSLGHRIFVNKDDDNRNGIADLEESGPLDMDDKDLAKVEIAFDGDRFSGGYMLELWCDPGLRLHASKRKDCLLEGMGGQFEPAWGLLYGTTYWWPVYPGLNLPEAVYVEGVSLGANRVYWRLVHATIPETALVESVKVNVEEMVWPNQDESVETDYDEVTGNWNGFVLPARWYRSSSLVNMIKPKGASPGFIRAPYPKEVGGSWVGTGEISVPDAWAWLDLAELYGGSVWPADVPVQIVLSYEYEQSPNIAQGEYVDATPTVRRYRPGFFHNSGVILERRAEIQIYDTQHLLEAFHQSGHAAVIEGNAVTVETHKLHETGDNHEGELELKHNGVVWEHREHVHGLIIGLPYGLWGTHYQELRGGQTFRKLLDDAPKGDQTMTITVHRNADRTYDFTVKLGTDPEKSYPGWVRHGAPADLDHKLYLQSHWGGGVKFTSAKVRIP